MDRTSIDDSVEYPWCAKGLHRMTPANTLIARPDMAKRCRGCRADRAKERRLAEQAEAEELVSALVPDTNDYELPTGNLGRRWIADGKCSADPHAFQDFFFEPLIEDWAAEYCGDCLVKNLCFAYAVINKEQGVWGGTTETQRAKFGIVERLRVRQGWNALYAEWDDSIPRHVPSTVLPATPHYEPGREAIVQRAMDASDHVSIQAEAGVVRPQDVVRSLLGD